MRREWEPEDLIACWALVEGDATLVGNKTGATGLGFALLLKLFELEGRFPRHAGELPESSLQYIAEQVDPTDLRTSTPKAPTSSASPSRTSWASASSHGLRELAPSGSTEPATEPPTGACPRC